MSYAKTLNIGCECTDAVFRASFVKMKRVQMRISDRYGVFAYRQNLSIVDFLTHPAEYSLGADNRKNRRTTMPRKDTKMS
jgi:hypothetical protein